MFSGVSITGATIRDNIATAVAAEEAGYRTAWVAEVSGPDAVTIMAACAANTSRIGLATGIVSTFIRSPFLTAMTFSSLTDLAEGRVVAGFGTSTPAIVEGWHGLPFHPPLAATREFVRLFRQFVAGERVKASGIYSVRGASLRPSRFPIPVYLAALNDGMLRLAAEIADGVILNFPTIPYAEHALEVLHRELQRHGRDRAAFDIVANFRTGTDGFEPVATTLKRELITYLLAPVYQRVFRADSWGAEVERATGEWAAGRRAEAVGEIDPAFVDAHAVIGTRDECLAKVQRFLDLGIDNAVLFPVVGDGPETKARQIALVRSLAPA